MKDNQKFKDDRFSLTEASLGFFLEKKVIVFLMILLVVGWGILVSPFDWELGGPFRDPVPVDAIPDIGENQQIVFTQWPSGCGGPDHLPLDGLLNGGSRCQDRAQLFHVRFFVHLRDLPG